MYTTYLPLVSKGDTMHSGEYNSFGQILTKVLDISKYQDDNNTPERPDFKKAREKGTRGVVIRISANNGMDEDADYNWKAAQDADIVPMAYHWFEYRKGIMVGGKEQAETCLAVLDEINGGVENVPIWLDYEQPNSTWPPLPDYYTSISNLSRFSEVTDPATKRLIGLYGNRVTVASISPVPARTLTRPFWPAGWIFSRLIRAEEIVGLSWRPNISPWKDFTIWQVGMTYGLEYGMESKEVDLNFFNGTAEQLYEFAGYSVPTDPTQPPADPLTLQEQIDLIKVDIEKLKQEMKDHGWDV